jgi:outer membrane protein assembly factor BamD (BamD/ComL family)
MTVFKLQELQRKLSQLRTLISEENKTEKPASEKHLAEFVMLNPHDSDYARQLEQLLSVMPKHDPLRDNVLLAQIKIIADELLQAEKLNQLHDEFRDTDGGIEALHELGLLKIRVWRQQDQANAEQKKQYLLQARETLTSFISLYPDSICAEQVRKNLEDLPTVD